MYGYLTIAVCSLLLFIRSILFPIFTYLRDFKGLRKYPNMTRISGITNIPYILESRRGHRSKKLAELHRKHPVIRVGPNALSYGDCRAIKDIYGHGSRCNKDDMYSILSGGHTILADVVDKSHHAQKRKTLSSAYAIKNLESWEHKVADKVQRLIMHIDKCCTAPLSQGHTPLPEDVNLDYRAWTNFFTMDAITDIGLSRTLEFLDKGNDETTCEALDGTLRTVKYRESLHSLLIAQSHIAWSYRNYHRLRRLSNLLPSYRRLWKLGEGYDGIVLHQVNQRLQRYQAGEKLDDFFQALMERRNGVANNLELGEIIAEVSIMLNAGSVSTAVAINNAMYLLLKNPVALKKLREELDDSLDEEDVIIPYDKIKYLPYLRACLDEAMRIFPPTPFNLPRKTPSDGIVILGDFIPGGTTVGISAYVAHRDPRIFPDPEVFRPERWLGDSGAKLGLYFLTFSAGSRGCIGRNISYLENYMLTAAVLHRYDFALKSPEWEQHRYEHFNQIPGPLPLKVWRRNLTKE